MDTERFERAVGEHQRMVFNLALHMLRDRGQAEETAQEVFLSLLQQGGRIESDAHLLHWLRQVASRKCLDQLRRRRVRRWLALEDHAAEVATPARQGDPIAGARLERAIRGLPAATQVALALRYREDLDPAEIGRVMGLKEAAVRRKLRQAVTALRRRMEGGGAAACGDANWEQP